MKRSVRIVSFALSLLFVFSLLVSTLPLSAAAQTPAAKRFCFTALEGAQGSSYSAEGKETLSLTLSATESVFTVPEGALALLGNSEETNAVYVSLVNRSNATSIRLSYQYLSDHETVNESAEQALLANDEEEQSFYLQTPHISSGISAITVAFLGEQPLSGTVTISSFCDLSLYTADAEGDVSSTPWSTAMICRYDAETETITISGQLNHLALARYRGEVLALFALDPTEELSLSKKRPIASADLSSTFSFSVDADSAEALFSRYVIAAETQKGTREPLCTPVYPSVTIAQTERDLGFKGFHTQSVSDILDVGADVEILDVYLDKLHGDADTGILYVGDEYYYFNREYLSELDHRIRRLTGAGCAVYLRFLISPEPAERQPYFVFGSSSENVQNKGVVIQTTEALNAVYALTDFLTLRYADDTIGTISGIVLGRSVDQAKIYNDIGTYTLAEYSELYAAYLQLVAGTARRNIGTVDIVVPLSDRVFEGVLSTEDLSGDYYPIIFLTSLLRALEGNTESPASFSLMIESAETPGVLHVANGEHYGIDGISIPESALRQLAAQYPFLDTGLLYNWMPDASLSVNQLTAAYVWQYIKLYYDAGIKGFSVDFSRIEETAAKEAAEVLSYIAKQIDTADSESVTLPTLPTLGISALTDISPIYSAATMVNRSIIKQKLSTIGYSSGKKLTGTYTYWNFEKATDVSDWYIGTHFTELSMLSDATGRALTAYCESDTAGEYAEIVYHFSPYKNLSVAPYSRFQLAVSGDANASYEVQIRFEGKDLTTVSSAVLQGNGKNTDLYIDLSAHADLLSSVSAVRIMVRALGGNTEEYSLRLYRAAFESTTLNDADLAAQMAQQTDTPDQGGDSGADDSHFVTAIIVTLAVVLVSVILILIFVFKQHRSNAALRDKRSD